MITQINIFQIITTTVPIRPRIVISYTMKREFVNLMESRLQVASSGTNNKKKDPNFYFSKVSNINRTEFRIILGLSCAYSPIAKPPLKSASCPSPPLHIVFSREPPSPFLKIRFFCESFNIDFFILKLHPIFPV